MSTPDHQLMHCLIPGPPLERMLTEEGKRVPEGEVGHKWETFLMVCQRCWEVQLHSFNKDHSKGSIVITNRGDSHCGTEEGWEELDD